MLARLAVASLSLLALACTKTTSSAPTACPDPGATTADASPPTAIEGVDPGSDTTAWIAEHYEKTEARVPMRDGLTLFTTIYTPKGRDTPAPILLKRTPYSVDPYGEDAMPSSLGPSEEVMRREYIFVYQDVRGRFMSEGDFVNMRPHIDNKQGDAIDESSDTYDTIEWLLANVDGHNGRVGMYGTSYPGFYAAAGMIDAHPALRAVSPQAPIADWFFDDFHHHGAFFLPHAFNFLTVFGRARKGLETEWGERFDHGTSDGYDFFLDLGALSNANPRFLHNEIAFWDEVAAHPNYDEFWQARNLLPHLHGVAPAVLTVGGLFDAEDLYGPWQIYRTIERDNPDVFNAVVMGPWRHGGWHRGAGDHLGNISFEGEHSAFFRTQIELPFFAHYLEGDAKGPVDLPEAYVFETGANRWQTFDAWPPAANATPMYMAPEGGLVRTSPTDRRAFDQFVSDPARPVPFTEAVDKGMTREYMTDDQRFASRRPDVLTFTTEPLTAPLSVGGPVTAELWVSTDQADADWVVKLIDVFPDDAPDHEFLAPGQHMSGYQMMVRSEVIRGRFRNSYEKPERFVSGRPTKVTLPLQDVLHTFEPGHRVMIQVQSTWFPLVDRNPQGWVDNIFEATDDDFVSATHRVYRDKAHASHVVLPVITLPSGQ